MTLSKCNLRARGARIATHPTSLLSGSGKDNSGSYRWHVTAGHISIGCFSEDYSLDLLFRVATRCNRAISDPLQVLGNGK